MSVDPSTTAGRAAIRKRAELAQEAADHINDVTFDGHSPSTVAWQTIAESQADVPTILDALDQAEKVADTQRKVADAFKQALADEYRPHVAQNKAYGMALDVQEKEITELRERAEEAEAALDRVRSELTELINESPYGLHGDYGPVVVLGEQISNVLDGVS